MRRERSTRLDMAQAVSRLVGLLQEQLGRTETQSGVTARRMCRRPHTTRDIAATPNCMQTNAE